MDWTHFHLMMNHVPVIGSIFGFVLLTWGILRGSGEIKKVALSVLVLTAVFAIPVYLTGEPAEETVEALAGVNEAVIERHEDFAVFALIAAIVSGAVALAGLFVMRWAESVQRAAMLVTVVIAAITAGMMGWTANLGGEIRHTEIRGSSIPTEAPAKEPARKAKADDDD